jgi:hypothetical protein
LRTTGAVHLVVLYHIAVEELPMVFRNLIVFVVLFLGASGLSFAQSAGSE